MGNEMTTTLSTGWLARTCQSAHIRSMAHSSPLALRAAGFEAATPISVGDTAELFEFLDVRFRAWTGQGLADYLESLKEKS